ncbi:unnamed protein product [Orchesella dallaii]|uniref:Uncharacterized protein n=1 Tax=Orchesella dallaii TaxID=48710 RepID=A0ABP1PZ16_9HEXA
MSEARAVEILNHYRKAGSYNEKFSEERSALYWKILLDHPEFAKLPECDQVVFKFKHVNTHFTLSNLNFAISCEDLKIIAAFDSSTSKRDIFSTLSVSLFGNTSFENIIRVIVAFNVISRKLTIQGIKTGCIANSILKGTFLLNTANLMQIITEAAYVRAVVFMYHDFNNICVKFSPVQLDNSDYLPLAAIVNVQGECAFVIPTLRNASLNLNIFNPTHEVSVDYDAIHGVTFTNRAIRLEVSNSLPLNPRSPKVEWVEKYGRRIRKIFPIEVPLQVFLNPTLHKHHFQTWLVEYGAVVCKLSKKDWSLIRPKMKPFKFQQALTFYRQISTEYASKKVYRVDTLPTPHRMALCEAVGKQDCSTTSELVSDSSFEDIAVCSNVLYGFDWTSELVEEWRGGFNPHLMTCKAFEVILGNREVKGVNSPQFLTGTEKT